MILMMLAALFKLNPMPFVHYQNKMSRVCFSHAVSLFPLFAVIARVGKCFVK